MDIFWNYTIYFIMCEAKFSKVRLEIFRSLELSAYLKQTVYHTVQGGFNLKVCGKTPTV